ncbi:MAG: RimK family alpha-L-glutamate ligase [Lachnospiraceae bacterium]
MRTGWFIVNQFLNTAKFQELYQWLIKAAQKQQIRLLPKTNADFLFRADSGQMISAGHAEQTPDFVLFWDKDIRLARALEKTGLRLFNCADAIEACDDKSLSAVRLAGIVKMPRTYLAPMTYPNIGYTDFAFLSSVEQELSYPFVIKECFGSFGMQVYLTHSRSETAAILSQNAGNAFLFQEYIHTSTGRDIRLHIVGGKHVTSMLRYNEHDFRANITNGGSMKPYEPSADQIRLAQEVCRELRLDFAGVDILFGEHDEPILCEVNSNSHFKNIFDCTGINVADAIMTYIDKELDRCAR